MEREFVFEEKKSKFMKRKSVTEEKTKVKHLDGRRNTSMEGRASCSCSGPGPESSSCCSKATECLCSACLLCVFCPLAIVWCCVKLPCKLGWRAARRASHRTCCGSEKRISASYSSFSDIESDFRPEDKVQPRGSKSMGKCFNKMS